MSTKAIDQQAQRSSAPVKRALSVVWQDPTDRRFVPIATLEHLVDGRYVFSYRPEARNNERFFPLTEYPDTARSYVGASLPSFFANRVMSDRRPSYGRYLEWMGLDAVDASDVPLELLARTGGGRATDTFHIVDLPTQNDHSFDSRFFVSGLSHVDDIERTIEGIRAGDHFALRPDSENVKNSDAVIIDTASGQQIGWVPDWLCGEVTKLSRDGWSFEIVAERVNRDAPAHTKVLCRLEGTRAQRALDPTATA